LVADWSGILLLARAEQEEGQVEYEQIELNRLQAQLKGEQQTASEHAANAGQARQLAASLGNPAEKAEENHVAEAENGQATQAKAEASVIEQRIVPVQAEINRLRENITRLNREAAKLAPPEK
jgi:hypothetical protein